MGVADVIPGVSGGTIALILNIYERLIAAIKSISPASVISILKNLTKPKELFRIIKELDLLFLIVLAGGIFTAVISLSSIIPNLVFKHTEYTFGCFIGLIIPSIFIPWKMIKSKTISTYISLLAGLALTITFSYVMKEHVSSSSYDGNFSSAVIILFFSAVLAISAMILPGISGSFILMLLGQYLFVSGLIARLKVDLLGSSVNERKRMALELVEGFSTTEACILIAVFMAGCVIGILLMSRLIHFCLKKSHDVTMAFLTGMICSSVYVLWPYKEAKPDGIDMKDWMPKAPNIIPEMNSTTTTSIVIFIIALICSTAFIMYGNKRTENQDS